MTSITAEIAQKPDSPLLASRVDAARYLCLSVAEVDNLRRSGQLRAKRYGRKVLFPYSELEKLADRLPWELDLPEEAGQ